MDSEDIFLTAQDFPMYPEISEQIIAELNSLLLKLEKDETTTHQELLDLKADMLKHPELYISDTLKVEMSIIDKKVRH